MGDKFAQFDVAGDKAEGGGEGGFSEAVIKILLFFILLFVLRYFFPNLKLTYNNYQTLQQQRSGKSVSTTYIQFGGEDTLTKHGGGMVKEKEKEDAHLKKIEQFHRCITRKGRDPILTIDQDTVTKMKKLVYLPHESAGVVNSEVVGNRLVLKLGKVITSKNGEEVDVGSLPKGLLLFHTHCHAPSLTKEERIATHIMGPSKRDILGMIRSTMRLDTAGEIVVTEGGLFLYLPTGEFMKRMYTNGIKEYENLEKELSKPSSHPTFGAYVDWLRNLGIVLIPLRQEDWYNVVTYMPQSFYKTLEEDIHAH